MCGFGVLCAKMKSLALVDVATFKWLRPHVAHAKASFTAAEMFHDFFEVDGQAPKNMRQELFRGWLLYESTQVLQEQGLPPLRSILWTLGRFEHENSGPMERLHMTAYATFFRRKTLTVRKVHRFLCVRIPLALPRMSRNWVGHCNSVANRRALQDPQSVPNTN